MSGGIALVDEPELSMHPKWQQKVLQYYRNLFNKDGSQDAQMILATHSEYVLRSALEDRDTGKHSLSTSDAALSYVTLPQRRSGPSWCDNQCICAAESSNRWNGGSALRRGEENSVLLHLGAASGFNKTRKKFAL